MESNRGLLFHLMAWAHFAAARAFFRLRWEGRENVPLEGPAVLCANHASFIDPPVLTFPLYFGPGRRMVTWLALDSYFRGLWGWYVRFYDSLPVPESGTAMEAFRGGFKALREGRLLGIFPEGARTTDGRLQPFQEGAARLAAHAGVPVVPVTINGTWDAWPPHRSLPRPARVEVIYHPPVPTDRRRRRDAAYLEGLTARLRETVAGGIRPPASRPSGEG